MLRTYKRKGKRGKKKKKKEEKKKETAQKKNEGSWIRCKKTKESASCAWGTKNITGWSNWVDERAICSVRNISHDSARCPERNRKILIREKGIGQAGAFKDAASKLLGNRVMLTK
eukprot:TRINITY_DN3837_c1_g2_i2.p1 TRINITY_DN3837_c1_g2~~TRINITY_DN3837_c1_g2_i2.p1  ORF type:complete len:115 (-),score=14.09 TRINITY_DN3837_c1_g2_i2:46-390(-)